jgi:CRISPR-associated protein Cas2
MSLYIISYDIAKTKLRNQTAKLLESYGSRVQYSVFECELDRERYQSLYGKLCDITLDEETDSIRMYRLCGKCEEMSVFLGNQKKGIRQLMKDTIVI